jgi:hypothetical protein
MDSIYLYDPNGLQDRIRLPQVRDPHLADAIDLLPPTRNRIPIDRVNTPRAITSR